MRTIRHFNSVDSFITPNFFVKKINLDDEAVNQKILSHFIHSKVVNKSYCNLRTWKKNKLQLWQFCLKNSNELFAYAGFGTAFVDAYQEVELICCLKNNPSDWSYALEVIMSCIELAQYVMNLDNLIWFIPEDKQFLRSLSEEAGFKHERTNILHRTAYELNRIKKPLEVAIVPYNSKWQDLYVHEAARIQEALGGRLCTIHHIGSTSINQMSAKPIIDLLLECENLDSVKLLAEKLNALGYPAMRRHVVPHRSYFMRKSDEEVDFHLHIRERGDPQIRRHINFRDYLSEHPHEAQAYAFLKTNLASQYKDDRNAYVFGKDSFVQTLDSRANQWEGRRKNYLSQNTGQKARCWTRKKIQKALDANLNVQMTHFAQYINQIQLIRIPNYTLVNTGLQDDTFNYVLAADILPKDVDAKIQEIIQYFSQQGVPFSWWVSPFSRPDNLSMHLKYYGFVNTENKIAMAINLDDWHGTQGIPSELEIIMAYDENTLRDFAAVLPNDNDAFQHYFSSIAATLTGEDPVEFYVGYVGGKPVVRGSICFFSQVAGMYWQSTAIEEKGKGYGRAMQEFRLKRAKDLGFHIAVLLASSRDYSWYRRFGYEACGVYNYFKFS